MKDLACRFFISLLVCAALAGCDKTEPSYRERTLSEWIDEMNTKSFNRHANAVAALVHIGRPAQQALARALDDLDADIRCGAATALLRINPREGLRIIRPCLEGGAPRQQISAAQGLIRANIEPDRAVPVLAALMGHEEYYIRNSAIKALGELKRHSTAAVPALVHLLEHDPDPQVRWRAAYALVRIGPGAAAAIEPLTAALADDDHRVREGAAFALGAIGPAAKSAREALKVAMRDQDPKVRWRAARALRQL